MRNPKRIDEFCNKLAEYWHKVPDWRFGQLICNVWGEELGDRDPFFPEEDKMLEMFEHFFNKNHQPGEIVNNHIDLVEK